MSAGMSGPHGGERSRSVTRSPSLRCSAPVGGGGGDGQKEVKDRGMAQHAGIYVETLCGWGTRLPVYAGLAFCDAESLIAVMCSPPWPLFKSTRAGW